MAVIETHGQNRLANLVVIGGEMSQVEVAVGVHRVHHNTLLEVLFK